MTLPDPSKLFPAYSILLLLLGLGAAFTFPTSCQRQATPRQEFKQNESGDDDKTSPTSKMPEKVRRLNICLISDFFYPDKGGVETHIYNLAQCLILRGHKVIVVTGSFNERTGVRHLTNGLKVYHTPIIVMAR